MSALISRDKDIFLKITESSDIHVHVEPKGVCCTSIDFEMVDNRSRVENIFITGGCSGNSQALCALCNGQSPTYIIDKCANIKCGSKNTSCPDKLAKAILAVLSPDKIDSDEFKLYSIIELN